MTNGEKLIEIIKNQEEEIEYVINCPQFLNSFYSHMFSVSPEQCAHNKCLECKRKFLEREIKTHE